VKRNDKTVRVTGVLQQKHDRIRLDRPVPVAAGPVSITIRPAARRVRRRTKELDILDLAGTGRDIFKGIDVDKWLDDLRNEWDRKLP
jgi:hypothetical protein